MRQNRCVFSLWLFVVCGLWFVVCGYSKLQSLPGDFQDSLALKPCNGLKCGTVWLVTMPTREAISEVQQMALILSPGF